MRKLRFDGESDEQFRRRAEQAAQHARHLIDAFILHGENYISMQLFEAAQEYFASRSSGESDHSEVQYDQT